MATVVSQPRLDSMLGFLPQQTTESTYIPAKDELRVFMTAEEEKVAQITRDVIRSLESQPQTVPSIGYLQDAKVQEMVLQEVAAQYRPAQLEIEGVAEGPNIAAVVAITTELVVQQTIAIPRILVVPKGDVTSGFNLFKLAMSNINYQPVDRDILIQYLREHQQETLAALGNAQTELRLENYLVRVLVDFDDISYDNHADLLYDLAGQMVVHLKTHLKDESEVQNVLQYYHRQLAEFIHAQMQFNHWEKVAGYEVVVSKGFTALKERAFNKLAEEPLYDFRQPVNDKSRIAQMVFGGFKRCLYGEEKFQSDSERMLSVILDREAEKWFKPARSQFQIFYKCGADQREYQPDFVAENMSITGLAAQFVVT